MSFNIFTEEQLSLRWKMRIRAGNTMTHACRLVLPAVSRCMFALAAFSRSLLQLKPESASDLGTGQGALSMNMPTVTSVRWSLFTFSIADEDPLSRFKRIGRMAQSAGISTVLE